MSKLDSWKCDCCGAEQDSHMYTNMFRPTGWYTVDPPKGNSKHLCSPECLGKWIGKPINQYRSWWKRIFG